MQGPLVDTHSQTIKTEKAGKIPQIQDACDAADFAALAALAGTRYGLISDELRKRAWPILLGDSTEDEVLPKSETSARWQDLPVHKDEHQVQLDVDRSFIYYPPNQSQQELDWRKEELSNVITETLRRQPYLCYFQGYHDICQVLLLVLGPRACVPAVLRLSVLRIRDFMLPSLAPALSHLHLLPSILHAADPSLCRHLSSTQPFFALAATLTLYAHDIQEYGDIARLFDVLLAREASYSIYLFARVVLMRKKELMDIPPDEPEMLHSILCKLPQPLNLEDLVARTSELVRRHPPETLPPWRHISAYSVLKTASSPQVAAAQTLREGANLFRAQAMQLRRAELREQLLRRIWRHRRPVGSVGIAVLIVTLAWWMRRYPLAGYAVESIVRPVYRRLLAAWTSTASGL